jgi:hypothetical protein
MVVLRPGTVHRHTKAPAGQLSLDPPSILSRSDS